VTRGTVKKIPEGHANLQQFFKQEKAFNNTVEKTVVKK
jgi:hypothetical protein